MLTTTYAGKIKNVLLNRSLTRSLLVSAPLILIRTISFSQFLSYLHFSNFLRLNPSFQFSRFKVPEDNLKCNTSQSEETFQMDFDATRQGLLNSEDEALTLFTIC